jgi:glycosyltransferase involved in cell wall biosynthesis
VPDLKTNALRIAQIAPLYEAVPPRLYGGTERVVAALTDALVETGNQVTLFASGDSCTHARLHPTRHAALRLEESPLKNELGAHLGMLARVRQLAGGFDVLHFHTDLLHLPIFEGLASKCVTTLHGRLDLLDLECVYRQWSAFGLVSVSAQQRGPLAWANWLATVPHGLPSSGYPVGLGEGGYLAFLGRISPEKSPDAAIRIAARAQMPLKMAAKVDGVDRVYHSQIVEPLLKTPGVEFVGEITDRQKPQFLGAASALIFPIRWPEPFGLVMIEAMACGTPVIAYDAGSVREVVEDGVTGFIVSNESEAVEAIGRLGSLSRVRVRAEFERRFTARRMAKDYLGVYRRLLSREPILSRVAV